MTLETELKLQAFLDGELTPPEARAVEELLADSTEAQALLAELRLTKTALHGNELESKLNETREFYWSQIERSITAQAGRETASARRISLFGWKQILSTLAGVTAVFALILSTTSRSPTPMAFIPDDVETASDQVEALTFQDHQANMTVVWLQAHPTSFTSSAVDDSIQPQ